MDELENTEFLLALQQEQIYEMKKAASISTYLALIVAAVIYTLFFDSIATNTFELLVKQPMSSDLTGNVRKTPDKSRTPPASGKKGKIETLIASRKIDIFP